MSFMAKRDGLLVEDFLTVLMRHAMCELCLNYAGELLHERVFIHDVGVPGLRKNLRKLREAIHGRVVGVYRWRGGPWGLHARAWGSACARLGSACARLGVLTMS